MGTMRFSTRQKKLADLVTEFMKLLIHIIPPNRAPVEDFLQVLSFHLNNPDRLCRLGIKKTSFSANFSERTLFLGG